MLKQICVTSHSNRYGTELVHLKNLTLLII